MKKIYVPLFEAERNALIALAQREHRDPRAQAAYLIRQSLEQLGLLQPIGQPTAPKMEGHREPGRN
jgi:hypothetical protein